MSEALYFPDALAPRLDDDALRAEIGGKALGLLRLREAGLEAPAWFVIPIGAEPDDDALAAALETLWGDEDPGAVAARSSAAGEDGEAHSFAGQLESRLQLGDLEALREGIAEVRASANSERALSYAQERGLEPSALQVAVIVQKMLPGEVSGVAYSHDPADSEFALISAAYGLCEGVVSGAVDADTYRVRAAGLEDLAQINVDQLVGREVEAEVAPKEQRVVVNPDGGTKLSEVPAPAQKFAALADGQVIAVARMARLAAAAAGRPQDIEWTLAGDKLWFLQSRAITAPPAPAPAPEPPPKPEGRTRLWDNSNIIESYAGVTTPLTYSFARHAYYVVYQQFCAVMGVPKATIQRNEDTFRVMIGYLRGRIYYNLNSWYRVLSLLPGFAYNKAFMEQMMGVSEAATYEPEVPAQSPLRRYGVELPRLLWLIGRMGYNLWSLPRRVRRFQAEFNDALNTYDTPALDTGNPDDLMATWQTLERRLLWRWQAPIVNDFFAMIFYGVLRSLCEKWLPSQEGQGPGLQNDLLCGIGGLVSLEPTRAAIELARQAAGDPPLRDALTETRSSPEERLAALRAAADVGDHAEFMAAFDDYLARWGSRCMDELKLEEATLADSPGFLISVIANYLRQEGGVPDPAQMERREREIRDHAEREVAAHLSGKRRRIFDWVLRHARTHVRDREEMRFSRTRIFGVVRRIFRAIGDDMAAQGLIASADEVFYLTLDELWGYVDGTATSTRFAELVALRRAETDAWREAEALPERFPTHGPVHRGEQLRHAAEQPAALDDGERIEGIGCAPGRVRGAARVVHRPDDDVSLDGQILVAERTDPGWVPLFPSASAIAIERGSVLSHSAVVARELGVPTVVGARGLLARVGEGDDLELDGGEGWVRVLKSAS